MLQHGPDDCPARAFVFASANRPLGVVFFELLEQRQLEQGLEVVRSFVVVAVPDSGTPHAVGFAQEMGIPYTEGFTKNRYVGRTFIEPTQELRESKVRMKFNPLGDNLVGKRVVMVDDSIVRGTTSGPLVQMLRNAGATEVHVRVACPAITDPCYMGVDMAAREDLIAANMSVEEIADHILSHRTASVAVA